MKPLTRSLDSVGVKVDYRPGGVSMTNINFALLEADRRRNAERVLFMLANVDPTELRRLGIAADDGAKEALMRQVQSLDARIDELHEAHDRITQHHKSFLDSLEWKQKVFLSASRGRGIPDRFTEALLQESKATDGFSL